LAKRENNGRKKSALAFAGFTHFFEALEDFFDARRAEPVKNLLAPAFIQDKPRVPQHGKVIGHRRDIAADELGEIGHATFPVGQRVHDEQPAGVPQGFENVRPGPVFLRGTRLVAFRLGGFRFHVWQNGKTSKE
jgi:hypothetical protein